MMTLSRRHMLFGTAGAASAAVLTLPSFPSIATASALPSTGTGTTFDSLGTTDDARVVEMNRLAAAHGGNPTLVFLFAARFHDIGTPIQLTSGLKMMSVNPTPCREFSRSTVIRWIGSAGSSLFTFPSQQTNQSYPPSPAPRDVTVAGIQFDGVNPGCHFISPTPGYTPARVLWYCSFHDCAWRSWDTIWNGYGTGCSISGSTHIQGTTGTAFTLGGSECSVFGSDAKSFVDTTASSKPFFVCHLDKSNIGNAMITSRGAATQLEITGGRGLRVGSLEFDAQHAYPVYGAEVRITGGTGIVLRDCHFKGGMSSPANGPGGAARNRGWIHVEGGQMIIIDGCLFERGGQNPAPETAPLVYVGPNVGDGQVRWGLNGWESFGAKAHLLQSRSTQLYGHFGDPMLTVDTAAVT